MSLHLGNMSPRIRKDGLERAFRRFGRCTVQLKDGYGFAVYDFHGDAEKALRVLKGRKICGEAIHLSWSNKQPKSLQRFQRAARPHDMQYRRNSNRVDNYVGRDISRNRGDYLVSDKQPVHSGGRHRSVEIPDDTVGFNLSNKGFERSNEEEEFVEEKGHIEPNHGDTGRWGEEVDNLQNDNDIDEGMGFNRYEPDCGDERDEEHEIQGLGRFANSPSGHTSLDNNRRMHPPPHKRAQQTCFKCGASGHKMSDCPSEGAFYGKKSYHSDNWHENEIKNRVRGEVRRPYSRSRERLQSSSRDPRSARQHETFRKPSYSEKNATNGSYTLKNKYNRTKRKDYIRKRPRERDDQVVETNRGKKSRRVDSSHLHSVHVSPGPNSRSRSGSPVYSLSMSSRTKSRSNQTGHRSLKSKSRSRSSSPFSSLSVSLGQPLHYPSNKEGGNLNGSFDRLPRPQSKEMLTEVSKQFDPETRERCFLIANFTSLSGQIDNGTSHQFGKVITDRKQLYPHSEYENPTCTNYAEASLNSSLEVDLLPQSQEVFLKERQQLESIATEAQIADKVVKTEDRDQLHKDENNLTIPHISCEPSSLEQNDEDNRDTVDGEASGEKLREAKELENAQALEMMKTLNPCNKSDARAPTSHLSIHTEELRRVLKHYGLKHPDEKEQVNVGDYFGSARMWPWEMIYYRRLKKGSVSKENYARRVAQSEAFDITDKYIRSSSGWGELNEKHLYKESLLSSFWCCS